MAPRTTPEREIDRFEAIGTDGSPYTVLRMQEFALRRTINGELVRLDGVSYFKLSSGEHVNSLKDGSFQIFETGKIIRKVGQFNAGEK